MAVSQAAIKADILALGEDMRETEYTESEYADEMATIIHDAILTADVQSGIPVSVTGTSTAQTGTTTGTGSLI